MKVKLYLKEVLIIKEQLEKMINSTMEDIIKHNSDKSVKTDKLLLHLNDLIEQQIIVKEVIQKANTEKHKNGKANNYYIFYLSTLLKKNRDLYGKLNPDKRDKNAQITLSESAIIIKNIYHKMDETRTILTNFNNTKIIILEVNEKLNLVEITK